MKTTTTILDREIDRAKARALRADGDGKKYTIGSTGLGWYSMSTTRRGHWVGNVYIKGPRVGTVAVANDALHAVRHGIDRFGERE
jgi:hypothetical protein